MPIANVGDIEIYYMREGAGPTILFITGLAGTHEDWTPVIEHLKHEYDCIAMDNRGIGRSSKPETGYTMPILAQDCLGLLDSLSISRTHIVGLSMGGMAAQIIAVERPKLVDRLVIVATPAKHDSRYHHIQQVRKLMQKRMEPYEYQWAVTAWMFGTKTLAKSNFIDDWAKKAVENPYPQAPHAFRQLGEAINEFDLRALLEKISQPTLITVGEEDILIPPYHAKILAEGIPNGKLDVLPGLGHLCCFEDPKGFAERIASFFGK